MKWISNWLHEHRKAIVAGLVAGGAMLWQVHDHGITSDEWWQVIFSFAAGTGLVTAIPNRNYKKVTPSD